MKQLIYMIALCAVGTGGVFFEPFLSVFVYYHFAVLRPQFLWKWSLPPDAPWSYYVAIAALLAAAATLLGVFPRKPRGSETGQPAPPLPAAYAWVAAFAGWVLLTTLTARHVDVAWHWTYENLKIFLMFGAGAVLVQTFRQVESLYFMAAGTLAYIAFEVNYEYLVNHYMGIWINGYGGYDNNGAGLLLAMGVPLCYFAFEGLRKWWRWGFLLFVPVLIHAVLMTFSRGAMLSLLIASPLIYWRSRQKRLLTAVGLLLGLMLIPMMAGPQVRARFLTLEHTESDGSANLRYRSWEAAWRMACENPILGVGVRNSNLFSFQYGADMPGRTIHNQYLQVAADSGFVGAGLYIAVLASAWLALGRVRRSAAGRRDNEAETVHSVAAGVECSLAVFCIGAWFLSLETFELPYLLILLAAQLTRVPLPTPVTVEEQAASANEQVETTSPLHAPA